MSWGEHIIGGVTLEPYQIEGRDFLLGAGVNGNKWLADRPRLGKTFQTLAALNIRLGSFGGNVLVICPPGVRSNWRHQISNLREGDWKAMVIGFNEIAAKGLPSNAPDKFDIMIIDEAHALKNRDSQRTVAIYGPNSDGKGGIVERAWEVWCLSGTPQPQFANELWTHLRALAPSIIVNSMTERPFCYSDFEARYCNVHRGVHGRRISGARNSLELRTRIKPFFLGRDYDVLGDGRQPPKNELFYIEADADSLREIQELELSDEGKAIRAAVERDDIAALKKLELQAQKVREAWGLVKVGPIAEIVESECAEDSNTKFVLFAWHTKVIKALQKRLSKLGAVVIAGGMTSDQQDAAKYKLWNDPKCRVLIGQHLAAGEGIDLSIADELIIVEQSWTPKDNVQCAMRVFNIKKPRRSRVRTALLAGTTDAKVNYAVTQKAKASESVFGF